MPKKKNDSIPKEDSAEKIPHVNVVARSIADEMKESYLNYAMSVITSRALPDVRDGLKPVHRRILYTMQQMGLSAGAKFRKSAAVVGDVMGKYHPHGDSAIYDAMVQLGQDFKTRYPLVLGQGNFGSLDGDPAAAMRYTEAKLSRLSSELIQDLEKDTVEWRPNYDGTRKEPVVFPAAVPNLLLNGTLGIAVGMATNIPPHNMREVIDATVHLIDNPDATIDDIFTYVQGPDFPTGAVAYNQKEMKQAYASGRGGIVCRGEAEIIEDKKGQFAIIITSIPYRVNKSDLLEKIADLVRDKKIEGIRDLRDESTKDVRIVIELKSTAQPQKVLNAIYKHTQLEDTFHLNMVALVDGVPQTLSLKGVLVEFIAHRKEVVRRRTEHDLRIAEDREHILLGLSKALDHIDEIIKLIKQSKDVDDARANLMKKFSFSERQANAILEMRLQKLAGLERKKIEDELKEVQALIKKLKDILSSAAKILAVVKHELGAHREKYGDERKTRIVKSGVKIMSAEDLVADEENVLVLTEGGYIKRTNPSEYKAQKRGGVGVVDMGTKEEDFVTTLLTASTHSDVLFFSNKGKAYQTKMYDIPEGKRSTKGKALVNFLPLGEGENITSILAMPKEIKQAEALSLFMITKDGVAKRTPAKDFYEVRRSGLNAIKLGAGDELVRAAFVTKQDSIVLVTSNGQSIRFGANDIREMGRAAAGVKGMTIKKGDKIIGSEVVAKDAVKAELLVLSENGYGKKTPIDEYKIQKRGGSGVKAASVTAKTGKIMSLRVVDEELSELVVMSQKGQVIRTGLAEIPSLSRATQGVRIMKMRPGDAIASLICL